jgi:hypothetical protein
VFSVCFILVVETLRLINQALLKLKVCVPLHQGPGWILTTL